MKSKAAAKCVESSSSLFSKKRIGSLWKTTLSAFSVRRRSLHPKAADRPLLRPRRSRNLFPCPYLVFRSLLVLIRPQLILLLACIHNYRRTAHSSSTSGPFFSKPVTHLRCSVNGLNSTCKCRTRDLILMAHMPIMHADSQCRHSLRAFRNLPRLASLLRP